jgi:hypothetical protein
MRIKILQLSSDLFMLFFRPNRSYSNTLFVQDHVHVLQGEEEERRGYQNNQIFFFE